jgi:hypothetical protein
MIINRITVSLALTLACTGTAFAGPCTVRIADLERTIEASTAEGVAKPPAAQSGTAQAPADVTSQYKPESQGINMLQQAKELDKQGKEAECMDIVGKVATTKAPLVNK